MNAPRKTQPLKFNKDFANPPAQVLSMPGAAAANEPKPFRPQLNARVSESTLGEWMVYVARRKASNRRANSGELADQALVEFMRNHPVE